MKSPGKVNLRTNWPQHVDCSSLFSIIISLWPLSRISYYEKVYEGAYYSAHYSTFVWNHIVQPKDAADPLKERRTSYDTPDMGLEPMTLRLKVGCSADWANRALDCSWAVGVFLFRLLYSPLWKALAKSTWEQIDRNMSTVVHFFPQSYLYDLYPDYLTMKSLRRGLLCGSLQHLYFKSYRTI